ncbi:MAG TPA: hypothetical protein VLE50_06460 [Cellvibrio sp.]|nr:hypothetical protein [Cellvibrio sp.]
MNTRACATRKPVIRVWQGRSITGENILHFADPEDKEFISGSSIPVKNIHKEITNEK